MNKTCPRCKKSFPRTPEFFHRQNTSPDGMAYMCRPCKNADTAARADRNRQRNARPPVSAAVEPPAAPPVEAPPPGEAPAAPPSTREVLQLARAKLELERERGLRKELERQVLTSEGLREIIGTLGAPNVVAQPEWLAGASSPHSVTGTAVLFISDTHFDEVVQPSQIGGVNEYNRETAVASLRNTFRNAVKLLKGFMARAKYDGICVPLGGDLLSGNIHDELAETNEAPIQQSMIALEEILIEGLGGLADEFGKVHVPCVTGNHGRMHKKPRAKNRAFENFEWAVYQRLAGYFRNDSRLTFDIPDGPDVLWSIYGTRFLLTHGDQFRGGDGIGGVLVPIMRGVSRKQVKQQAMADPFDIALMGHFHQYIHTNRLIVNGSCKGYDEYAYQNNFPFEPAQQALFVVHPEVGCTFRMPVLCRKGGL